MALQDRVSSFQNKLQTGQLALLSNPADIKYFTGFDCLNPEEREAFCVIGKKSLTLLYPSFSPVKKYDFIEYHKGYWPADVKEVLSSPPYDVAEVCLVDTSSLYVSEYQQLELLEHLKLDSLDKQWIWDLRLKKDADELVALNKAGKVTADVMKALQQKVRAGITELELALECEILFKQAGSLELAFPPVIAFGEHTALPHHQPTDFALQKNMAILVDIGAKIDHYCGDMTRTWWFGDKPDDEFVKIESVVKAAYDAALAVVKADCHSNEIDKVARKVIEKAGYGKQFIHTTGHGLGLEIHEQPSIYLKRKVTLPEHAAITIEPGIYLEGKFGYRYENTVIVEKNGCKVLNLKD